MSEFETSEERQQAAIELISQISAMHQPNEHGLCTAEHYVWPCRTARAIEAYRGKFFTRYDAVMDAIYAIYDAEDLDNRTDQIGQLALRIADTWQQLVDSPAKVTYLLSGMLLMVSLDQEKALEASREIIKRVSTVRS